MQRPDSRVAAISRVRLSVNGPFTCGPYTNGRRLGSMFSVLRSAAAYRNNHAADCEVRTSASGHRPVVLRPPSPQSTVVIDAIAGPFTNGPYTGCSCRSADDPWRGEVVRGRGDACVARQRPAGRPPSSRSTVASTRSPGRSRAAPTPTGDVGVQRSAFCVLRPPTATTTRPIVGCCGPLRPPDGGAGWNM